MNIKSLLDGREEKLEIPLFQDKYSSSLVKQHAKSLARDFSNLSNSEIAGKILIYDIYRPCGDIEDYVEMMKMRLSPEIYYFLKSNAVKINEYLQECDSRNFDRYDFFSASSLIKNYLMRPHYEEDPLETPNQMFMRIAAQIFHKEGIERTLRCFDELSMGYYVPASPTIFNAGTKRAQMASCFLMTIEDDLRSILYNGVGDSGMISKLNGGLGININKIRHSAITGAGMSSGIMPVARIYDKTIKYVDQGGKRAGACTLFLRIWHIDVKEFIESTDNYKDHQLRLATLNTCLWMSRYFFQRAREDGEWTVFCPHKAKSLEGLYGIDFEIEYRRLEKVAKLRKKNYLAVKEKLGTLKKKIMEFEDHKSPESRKVRIEYRKTLKEKIRLKKLCIEHYTYKARELSELIAKTQIRSGMPYIMHGDSINAKSNQANIGKIQGSNLCLEITEATPRGKIASCNLSSINLQAYVTGKCVNNFKEAYDFQKLGEQTRHLVENLDGVIQENYYPLGQQGKGGKIGTLNMETRPLGIGVSGLSDAVQKMDMCYDELDTEVWNKHVFACIYFNAMASSVQLALEKGAYETFKTGEYKEYVGYEETKDGKIPVYQTMKGSPLSNGRFQFDLWKKEAERLDDFGQLNHQIYDVNDDEPIDPLEWGQGPIELTLDYDETHTIEPTWESLREAVIKFGVRNSLLIALMPTASSAQILGNTESTELPQSNIYTRQVLSGNFTVVNKYMVKDLEELGFWDNDVFQFISAQKGSIALLPRFIKDHNYELTPEKESRLNYLVRKYKSMYEISQKVTIRHAAQRGRYVCQSQSLNIYIADPTVMKLEAIHHYTNEIGLKTGMYYLRQDPPNYAGNFNIKSKILEYCLSLIDGDDLGLDDEPKFCTREEGCIACQ